LGDEIIGGRRRGRHQFLVVDEADAVDVLRHRVEHVLEGEERERGVIEGGLGRVVHQIRE
jgi:hypothetical protein